MGNDALVFDDERKFVIGLWLRVVAAGVFLALLLPLSIMGIDFPWSKCFPAYLGLAALILLNCVYWVAGKREGFPLSHFYVHWFLDLCLITIVLYGLGGALLPSSITAYILIVITSAVFISKKAALLVATGSAISYGGSIAAEVAGWIDPEYDLAVPALSQGMAVLVIGGPVFMVYLVAFIAGTLGDQLNALNRLLIERNRELRDRNESLNRMRSELDFQSKVLEHDVRSPVSAALSALAAFEAEGGDDQKDALLANAVQNLNRVEDMIDALQQAREGMESAEIWEEIDVHALIRELGVELDQHLAEENVTLGVEGEPVVTAMKSRLIVMFRNLVTNALRYVPTDGTGEITVGVSDGGQEWRLFVRDNGCGVKPEFQRVIFEMFRKAPQRQKSAGMGLGLALVRKVAEQHGGATWVESDGVSGSTFWVSIPKRPIGATMERDNAPVMEEA